MRKSILLHILWLCVVMLITIGCAQKPQPLVLPTEAKVAIAPFSQPSTPWEMLAGYAQEDANRISQTVLTDLDRVLADNVSRDSSLVIYPQRTKGCMEVVLDRAGSERQSALSHWVAVGECLKAEFVLVPHLVVWNEREGGKWGVQTPATVILDLFLIDVGRQSLFRRAHYEERQQSLTENILTVDKFIERGGKWVTAEELATFGIANGIKELGL